jgi:hypothetical protein
VSSKVKQAAIEFPLEQKPAVLKLIRDSSEPLTPAVIIVLADLPKKLTVKKVQAALDDEINSGQIFNWGTPAKHSYWHRGLHDEVQQRIVGLAANSLMDDDH